MNLRNAYGLAALTLCIGAPLAIVGCGLGGDANVGDQNLTGTGTGGSKTGTVPAGGSAGTTTPGGTGGGIASTGGAKGGGAGGGAAGATGGGIACGKSTCSAGQYCCDALCGTCAPMGAACTQGCAVEPGPACATDSDCSVSADYCTGCDCRVLAAGDSVPACTGPGVSCLVDPCMNTTAVCQNGTCVAKKPAPAPHCATDSDCSVSADYCTGCDCRVLGPGDSIPACTGPGVRCLVDPCRSTTAVCEKGACVAKKAPAAGACSTNADCTITADYCTGCDCRALAKGESLPACSGPGVQCLADPCMQKTAACVGGACVAQ